MNFKQTIRRILKEQGEQHKEEVQKKLNLVRKMIHRLYDNVSFIEQSTFNGKPHLTIYFDSDDTAANVESWFDEKIYRDIIELTSGSIVVCPDWAANWDSRKKEADVYINTELLRYDNLGNVINESSKSIRRILREESRPLEIRRRTHLIDNEIEKILKNPYFPKKVCKTYINTEQFITSVCEFCFRSLYSNTFYMMDDTSEEWEKIVVFIYEYVKDRYSEILKDYYKKHCGKRVETNESDPKVGTGKKPKGSGRRLYTDENPSDTVSVKFKTKQDIIDTLNKQSFKSKPHKRQSQIINLIHQRVRAAYQNSKNSETKKRLKTALDYIEIQKEKSKQKTIRLQKK